MKSGKSMPVVEYGLIVHTHLMNLSCNANRSFTTPAPTTSACRWFWLGRGHGWLKVAALCILLAVPCGYAKTDQSVIKENATKQIQKAAAHAFYTDPGNVEVRLADKRLVLPDCKQPFDVSLSLIHI